MKLKLSTLVLTFILSMAVFAFNSENTQEVDDSDFDETERAEVDLGHDLLAAAPLIQDGKCATVGIGLSAITACRTGPEDKWQLLVYTSFSCNGFGTCLRVSKFRKLVEKGEGSGIYRDRNKAVFKASLGVDGKFKLCAANRRKSWQCKTFS